MVCARCGREFTRKPRSRPDTRFCSDACRKLAWQYARYRSDPEWVDRRRAGNRVYYERLSGLQYARRLLQMRRAGAMKRRREASRD